ncbi:MAG: hypothetical protein WCJ95_15650 [Mariniphaga sp.]
MEDKNELPKNKNKSIFLLILGISMCLLSIFWIFARLAENDLIKPFDWIYAGFFALSGATNIFIGLDSSIERFFGKGNRSKQKLKNHHK